MADLSSPPRPLIQPLGDQALLIRFGDTLTDAANVAAIRLARLLQAAPPGGVIEIDPNLISVLLRFDAGKTNAENLAAELRLIMNTVDLDAPLPGARHSVAVTFDGPDLGEVAEGLGLSVKNFVAAHNATPLRVLSTGFAPGFVYCGFHPDELKLPRRATVRGRVPAGTVLFAAGQTAITASALPTGWHVIGTTEFRNFDAAALPPTRIHEGDEIQFEALS